MSSASTIIRRRGPVVGVALTAAVALGAGFLAGGASQAVTPTPRAATTPAGTPPDCPAIGLLVASAVTATAPGAPATAVSSALNRATGVARATASDDVRELAQNLADDLAAYRVTIATPSETSAQRHTDIGATISGDLTALRHICGQ